MTNATKRRILVVEDDPLVSQAIAQTLLRLGYEVVGVVDNGDDAVSQAFARTPDLVVMDVGLRGSIDGAEAARQIRLGVGRPVVFLTAQHEPSVLRRIKEAEPYGFVLKPFSQEQLFVQIELALHRHQIEAERAQLRPAQDAADKKLSELRGLLPICAGCKKIHENDGRWTKLEEYFNKHAGIEFTHGFCPDCENRLYGTHSRAPVRPK
jgi:two-component system, response regulator PdtaR